ncbi:hypothetical protein B0A50_08539 [Salinomyces thailandicus]|uniref:Transcription initiation factor TFIID subunit 12 domain-containing protein n=1 Tax=Salinomyces thailandicus TaxID=706561 RepID=A0A4U0TJN8_9PEZI|nr:hypothetical protein B0A50_08539 [Salinomyces thailandica]
MASSQPLVKPEQIDNLPFIEADKKQRYKQGLAQLWQQYEQNPPNSSQRQDAEGKIRSVSRKLMEEMAARNRQRTNSQQGIPQQPSGGQGPPPTHAQPQRPPTQSGMTGAAPQAGTPQQGGQQQGQSSSGQQHGGGSGGGGGNQIASWISRELASVTVHVPHNLAPANVPAYKQKWYATAAQELQKKERANEVGKALQPTVKECQANGTQAPPDVMQKWEAAKRMVQEVDAKWARMKADNENKGRMNQQAMQQGANGADMQHPGSMPGQQQGGVKQEPPHSPPQGQGNFQQPSKPANQPAPSALPPGMNQQQQPQAQSTPVPQPPHSHTPQSAGQPHPPQNFPQQPPQQQYSQQPQRPQLNQHISSAQIQQQQPQQTPPGQSVQNRPASAGPQQPAQRPQALSQQAAVAQAAQAYQHQQQLHQQQGPQTQQIPNQQAPPSAGQPGQQHPGQTPNGPGPGPHFGAPGSANHATPTSAGASGFGAGAPGHQPASIQATTTPNNKFPIPKQLQLDPRINQPVQGPPSRPTLAGAGMTAQPGIQRPAAYTLEGEGDRVLSKRKLDELVRQVTGGGSSSSDTDTDAAFLDPLVEENVLSLADDFVDNVITAACRLAKLRPNQMLELRDVQMVLERNWGIRVPGYTLEEVRQVKRFQPTLEWQKKMGAVGTAKTLGGVGKGDS